MIDAHLLVDETRQQSYVVRADVNRAEDLDFVGADEYAREQFARLARNAATDTGHRGDRREANV